QNLICRRRNKGVYLRTHPKRLHRTEKGEEIRSVGIIPVSKVLGIPNRSNFNLLGAEEILWLVCCAYCDINIVDRALVGLLQGDQTQ
ncbi:MAG: hypothetical protein K9K86_11725, partial [Pseudomonadales bacterium]|nr:hypothetical protein [Pseudomonadales bacterium]